MNTTTFDTTIEHCESCGAHGRDLGSFESYTACCNELVCHGTTREWESRGRNARNISACCRAALEATIGRREADEFALRHIPRHGF